MVSVNRPSSSESRHRASSVKSASSTPAMPMRSNGSTKHHHKKMNTFIKPTKDNDSSDDVITPYFDIEHNVVLIGDRGVGKTSIIFKSTTEMYSQSYLPTFGIDFRRNLVKKTDPKKVISLKLWDTPGTIPEITPISKDLFRSAAAFLCIYDVTNIQSYNNLLNWMKLVKKYALDQSQIVVIGNKTDLPNQRRLSKEDGMRLAASYGVKFMEVNVPQNHNIQKMLDRLALNLSK